VAGQKKFASFEEFARSPEETGLLIVTRSSSESWATSGITLLPLLVFPVA
jgi:hypothetical protein